MQKSPIFEKTYQDYLAQIADLDFTELEDLLGLQASGNGAIINFFGCCLNRRLQFFRVTLNRF